MDTTAQAPVIEWLKRRPWKSALVAGIGGALAIAILAATHELTELSVLIPPFGASCVLAFGFPASPFAQPKNIIGGHVISAIAGLIACSLLGYGVMGVSVGVGLAIAAMMVTDTVHPPAGANPVVIALTRPELSFVILPVLVGAVVVVMSAKAFRISLSDALRR